MSVLISFISIAVLTAVDQVLKGYVVDFIEVQFTDFAVFNFADILVTVGAIAIMIYVIVDMFRERKKTGEKHE